MLTLGSLFDGIGGFPLAASRYGITPVWASEIEKVPIEITKKHFPEMAHLGNITQIKGSEVEPVDIISFGSPCQDLSVAGKRGGLEGERSGLFVHAVRIVREMRRATNNKYPKFIIWENVPGAFSSNKGDDFRRVLQEIAEAEIPMPFGGKWANAGMVKLVDRGISWRVLDAQYWGVPQRRKRIFLIADFRENSRPEILFEQEGLRRDIKEGESEGKEVARAVRNSFGFQNKAGLSRPAGQGSKLNLVVCIQGNCIDRADTAGCNGAGARENVSYALNTVDRHAVCYGGCLGGGSKNLIVLNDQGGHSLSIESKELSPTIRAETHGNLPIIVNNYTIRRLTPLECERLQGFPDGWTVGHSDSARYRALGNSIAVPCAEFVFEKIQKELAGGLRD